MSGLGLTDFLGHDPGGGGGKAGWLQRWTDRKRDTSIDIYLSTKASFYPIFKTAFSHVDEVENDGRTIKKLFFDKFISPEPEIVLSGTNFRVRKRDMTSQLERPPTEDPFLILREWLLLHSGYDKNTIVFNWVDYNDRDKNEINWRKGDLTLENSRDERDWRANITPKLSYMLTVADASKMGDGLVLTEEGKMLCDAIRSVIGKEIESVGDDAGNPLITPYCIRLKNMPGAKIMDRYDALRVNRDGSGNELVMTDEIRKVITAEPPDAGPYVVPRDDDQTNIRAYMEMAARVKIPFDAIFSEDPAERARCALERGAPHSQVPFNAPPPAQTQAQTPATQQAPAAQGTVGRSRRRRKPPAVPMIPCDECNVLMPETAAKCEGCGAEYDVDAESAEVAPLTAPVQETQTEIPYTGPNDNTKCYLCNSVSVVSGVCGSCGAHQEGDDIPF